MYTKIYNDFIEYCKENTEMSKRELIDRFMTARCIADIDVRDMLETAYESSLKKKGSSKWI